MQKILVKLKEILKKLLQSSKTKNLKEMLEIMKLENDIRTQELRKNEIELRGKIQLVELEKLIKDKSKPEKIDKSRISY